MKEQKQKLKRKTREICEPPGWSFASLNQGDFESGLHYGTAHSGTRSAFIRCISKKPKPYGYLWQSFVPPADYIGKHLRMTAWMKTKDVEEGCQLYLRVHIEDRDSNVCGPSFDNMYRRRVTGTTDWTKYELVVDVPERSYFISFGMMLMSKGEAWLDSISFESVSRNVPVTSKAGVPQNLDFENDEDETGPKPSAVRKPKSPQATRKPNSKGGKKGGRG